MEKKAEEYAQACADYNNLSEEVKNLIHTAYIFGYNEGKADKS